MATNKDPTEAATTSHTKTLEIYQHRYDDRMLSAILSCKTDPGLVLFQIDMRINEVCIRDVYVLSLLRYKIKSKGTKPSNMSVDTKGYQNVCCSWLTVEAKRSNSG